MRFFYIDFLISYTCSPVASFSQLTAIIINSSICFLINIKENPQRKLTDHLRLPIEVVLPNLVLCCSLQFKLMIYYYHIISDSYIYIGFGIGYLLSMISTMLHNTFRSFYKHLSLTRYNRFGWCSPKRRHFEGYCTTRKSSCMKKKFCRYAIGCC